MIEKVGQIAIAISDLETSVKFYRDTLGLELLFEVPPGLAFFNCGGIRLMLTTPHGLEHDHKTSVVYYQVSDLQVATATLKQRGVTFEREPAFVAKMDQHNLWMGFLRDPDQNLVGLMAEIPFKAGDKRKYVIGDLN
ncbi:MAG: VOC family protein [Candidatus Marinimicrobia bacterium]|nr:VOC family protein [Candidatus Neomarinimicrobiota bacterium]